MKKIRFLFSMVLILSIVFSTILFTKDTTAVQAANSINLSEKALTMELGRYKTLKVYGTTARVSWYTGNSWIASVSGTGKVTAKAAGTTTITAKVAGRKLTCKVTVLRMKGKDLTLSSGKSSTVTIQGTNSNVIWISGDESIATVSSNGEVTAKALGATTISAFVDGKELIGKVSVIDINHKSFALELGGSYGFVKKLKVDNATGKVIWTSSNPSIASISADGKVTAKGTGSATITAVVNGLKMTSKVKVLKINNKELTLKPGQTKVLNIFGTSSKITWKSNNTDYATVSADGTVTAVASGKAIITGYVNGMRIMSYVTVTE